MLKFSGGYACMFTIISTFVFTFTVRASIYRSNDLYCCLLLGCRDRYTVLWCCCHLSSVTKYSYICSPSTGYSRTVVDMAGSFISYELYVAYFGVVGLRYATLKVVMILRDVYVAGCGNWLLPTLLRDWSFMRLTLMSHCLRANEFVILFIKLCVRPNINQIRTYYLSNWM